MEQQLDLEYLAQTNSVLANFLNFVHDGIYIVDRRRHILFWNRQAEQITGFSSEEVLGRWCGDNILCHIDSEGRLMCRGNCPLARAISSGEAQQDKIYPRHKSGHRFPTRTHVAPIRDGNGNIIAAVEVFRDISQEEELRLLHEKFNALVARYVSGATLQDILAQLKGGEGGSGMFRDMTVLYLDVVGFTRFSEGHLPDEAVQLLNDVFGMCEVISTEYYGDIDKFIGDCIMATFIDARDAFGAATQVLRAITAYNDMQPERGEAPIAVRIGINSGHVIQGEIGTLARKEYTVIGDVVNTAARLQHLAEPNGICLSEATRSRLPEDTPLHDAGEVHVPGRERPIRVYTYPVGG